MITLFRTSGEKTHVRCQSSTSLKDVQSLLHQECALVASGQFFLDPHSTPFAAARASVCGTRKENTISELALSQTVSCYMTGKNHKERDSNNALLQRQRRHDEFRNTSGRSVSEIQSKLTLPTQCCRASAAEKHDRRIWRWRKRKTIRKICHLDAVGHTLQQHHDLSYFMMRTTKWHR